MTEANFYKQMQAVAAENPCCRTCIEERRELVTLALILGGCMLVIGGAIGWGLHAWIR